MGNKASQNNKDQLQQYHQEENKYEDLHQGKEMTNLSYHKSEQSLTFNPLNIERQNKVYQLYETKIKPNHETELSGTKLVSWLSNYLSEERYRSDDAIREDLNDPQYSHLKEKMENDLQDNIDRKTADAIYTVLRNDIFSSSNNDGYVSPEYETSTTINDSETNNSINHHPIRGSIIEHDRTELDELNNQVQFDGIVNLLKQKTIEQEIQLEDEYGANKESFPEFINVALFGRSDDEYLEMLIDQALIKVCYDKKIGEIWTDPKFIQNLYNDNRFPSAVEQLYDKINHDDESVELDFIGDFVSKEFKRQINENKRRVEEEAINDKKEDEIQQRNMNKSNDFDEKYESSYNVFVEKNDDGIDEYIIRKKHLGEKLQHKKRKKLKDDDPLFQLQITSVEEHENDFCWAVFKKKRFKNNYGIKTKGRWEIITEEADKKRKDDEEERRRKQALSSSPNVFKNIMDDMAGKSGKNLLKGVGKKIAKSTRKLAHLDDTKEEEKLPPTPILPSKSTSNVQSNKNGKKKFQYIELAHLNVIFELLQYHYWHSIKEIKEKKSIESKNSKLVSSPMYHDYCALSEDSETITRQKTLLRKEKDYTIIIGDKTYKLCWWNMKGRRECNALAIQYNDRKYFYLHFRHNYEKIEDNKRISRLIFDWYDNDAARYKKYSPGIDHQVYKELEASFQANVDSNFPRSVFDVDAKNDRMFNVCILDELKKYLQETKGLNVDCMVLRFTFTQKTNRILNIEQVSLKKTSCFPRNVRRVLDQKNSLNSYWQNTNRFIEEWKFRYILSTKQQQLYFWSYILIIAATMKYIEIEFQYQLISIPFETNHKTTDPDYTGLDDSDLQRHKIDYQLWDGFFMPPSNQLQTAQISRNMSLTDDFEDWYENLSRVEPLSKFENGTLINKTSLFCQHGDDIEKGDILWYSKTTYNVYCNRCAVLLQFAETIRKYVLETDSHEVVDYTWPWYRNYFHRWDRKKYLKYIAKYNLSHLFLPRDVLRHLNKDNPSQQQNNCNYCNCFCCCKTDEEKDEHEEERPRQVRHLRKFAASVLLGPWDILRNLNVFKSQLQLLFRHLAEQRETSPNGNKQDEELPYLKYSKWQEWNEEINKANKEAQRQIKESNLKTNFKTLLELRHETDTTFSDDEQNILHALIQSIFEDEMDKEYDESQDIVDDQMRYYTSFKNSFHRVPKWWIIEHDILLMELGMKFNWNTEEINKELTDPSKKLYYQELLKQSNANMNYVEDIMEEKGFSDGYIGTDDEDDDLYDNDNNNNHNEYDDDFEYRGYQEFQVWCGDWRNLQHRLRYLSFTVCKKLDHCKPSIIEIRIPNEKDHLNQYKSSSFVFLNGYIEQVHLANCKLKSMKLNDIKIKNTKIKSLGNLSQRLIHKAQESQLIEREELNHKSRMRDPFMTRHLDFELEQICQAFDLLEYGVDIALFLIKLLARKQSNSLWSALGIVLEYMPYEKARFVLEKEREDLRHGQPEQLKNVCDKIIRGSSFSVHICLFLAEYMENNADQDLARHDQWMDFSKYYESEAGKTINEIESDHLLSVLMDIPLSDSGNEKVPLLQVALEQNRSQFLNNERINAVLKHVWQTPSGLAPNVDILRKSRTATEIWKLLLNQPFHFYLTAMGFNATIKACHLLYLLGIYIFISFRIYLHDPLEKPEMVLWSMNIGYFVYEIIECYDKGLKNYFTLAGWVNYWDLQISFTWIALFALRMWSYFENYQHFWKDELPTLSPTTPIDYSGPFEFADNPNRFQGHWHLAQAYYILFAIQTASLSARSLVLFQTSEYFGVLLRMMQRLIIEMSRFLVVLALILVGFVFGFYYIQGGYQVPFEGDVDVVQYAADWYTGFKYLFQLTVGVGDFSDIEDIVPDEITAQLFTILYIIFATILMMNLLIALMTTTFDNVYSQARTESSFAIAETTFDLSHRSRFMPAPICIHIMAIAIAIHIVNFFTSICFPKSLNIYNFIDHKRYKWLVETRLFWKQNVWCCGSNDNNDINDINDEVKEEDTYKLITRGRVWKYYLSTIFFWEPECIQKKIKGYRFNIHHSGCYSCIPTKLGAKIRDAEKDRSTCNGITLNQYAEEYEKYHKFALDPQDTVLLKHLTVDTLFCKHCFRPFDPKHVENSLLTPFWALSEVLSILLFPFTVWLPLLLVYFMVMFFEWIGSCFDDDVDDAPQVLDHDRQFFSRDSLHLQQDKQR